MSHNVQHQIAAIMRRRGGFSFGTALRLLEPYSPRLAYNFIDPANSLFQGNTLTTVTSATNPVGVVIDQTQGGLGNLGADRVTTTGISLSGDVGADVGLAITSGRAYLVSFTVSGYSGTGDVGFVGGTNFLSITGVTRISGNGSVSGVAIAVGSGNVRVFTRSTNSATFSNISVREIPGYHATASSDAKRPLFARYPATGRRNLLIKTESFESSAWVKASLQIDLNQLDVDGGDKAVRLRKTATTLQSVYQALAAGTYRNSIYVKADTVNRIGFSAGASSNLIIDIVTRTVIANNGSLTSVTIDSLEDGWCRISYVNTNGTALYMWPTDSSTLVFTTTSATASVFVCFPQAEIGSATATNYQRVVTSADITEAGVRDVYASLFDGADDCLQVSGFDLSDTDKVCVIAGVRKLSDATRGIMLEHSASVANNGTFNIEAPTSAAPNYAFLGKGTAPLGGYAPTGFAAPITNWISCVYDLSGAGLTTQIIPRINNAINQTGGFDTASGGNFINSTLNIGGRNNSASLPFSGYLHYLFVLGAIPPDSVLTRIYRGLAPQIGVSI